MDVDSAGSDNIDKSSAVFLWSDSFGTRRNSLWKLDTSCGDGDNHTNTTTNTNTNTYSDADTFTNTDANDCGCGFGM
jgi:hypothetical protein